MPSARSSNATVSDLSRRALDVAASAGGLVLLSPLLGVIALWVKLDSPGPVLYRATRVGRCGRPFVLLKFRTMVAEANRQGPAITFSEDHRITRAGHFLRRTKLDELPQLVNVLRGEMSLVGPRPEDPRYVALYTQEQRRVLLVRPGITSAASLVYRHEQSMLSGEGWESRYREDIMPAKLAVDLAYLAQRTIWSDFILILRTLITLLR